MPLSSRSLFASSASVSDGPSDEVTPGAKAGVPARAVRLSSADGQVQVVQDGQVIADPAIANEPLFEGSQIITGNDGRAEVQLEDGGVARISPNTTLTFSVLQQEGTGTRTEIVLNNGLAYFELQPSNAEHTLRVDYGTASFSASSASVMRLTEDAPPGELAVFSGNVHVEQGDSIELDVHGGENLALNATDPSQYNLSETIAPDSWDSWNADRDNLTNSESQDRTGATAALGSYDSEGMSDLDASGNWYNVPGQGYVWSPFDAESQGASWDPYGFGHWVYYPRYGFLWVSGYGWGYAPYQCGLWNYYDSFGWGWSPGGGCSPWGGFGLGFYGEGGGFYNIGSAPHGYRPPKRPLPIHPRPVRFGSRGVRVATVAVDRRPAETIGLPPSGRSSVPVMIAGHAVQPLRPLASRPAYSRTSTSFVGRPGGAQMGGAQTGYSPVGQHPVYNGNPGSRPANYGGVNRPTPGVSIPHPVAPASHPAASHPAPAPSHASSGGGGGGGGHASGGGGGGGGGGSHK